MKRILLILLLCSVWSSLILANIVTYPAPLSPSSWLSFRGKITLEEEVSAAELKIAADSKYWLWINGELVVREGGLKRGPNPQDTYCDVLTDLPQLRVGENTIALLVWYFGKESFSHRNSPTGGVYFDLAVNGKHYKSDKTWKTALHPAFYTPNRTTPNYRLPESNIGFDARKEVAFWSEDFDDSAWKSSVVKSNRESGWNNLVTRPIPQWKDFGLKPYQKVERSGDSLLIAHLPYNAQITPYIKVKSAAGKLIDIRTDNYLGGGTENVYAEYVTKEGEQAFEAFGWMNGHQVLYKLPKGVEVLEVMFRETGYDTAFAGSFSCNDPFYNKLWEKSLRTLYITMRDTYMDCPDRERAQWWGDVVNELGEAFYSLDSKAHLLTRKAILELMNWQRPDGTIFSPVPAGNWDQELPMQMLASVGYYGFWTYYLGTGDKETIEAVYPRVKSYLDVWKLDSEGLVIPRQGGWTWGDWGENKDFTLLYNLWYSLALKGFEQMALLVGETADAAWANQTNSHLKTLFHQKYWNGTYYVSPDYKESPDDRAQALAVVAGILPVDEYATLRPFFKTYYHASPYMEKYVLEALCMMGYYDDALARMRQRYNPMVQSELTTLWEGWGIGHEGYGGGSYNHAWSGGPLTILSQYFAGISPLQPAFKEFVVAPVGACFDSMHSVTPTLFGPIELTIHTAATQTTLRLTVPTNTKAHVTLPAHYKHYSLNGAAYKVNQGGIQLTQGSWMFELK